MCNPNLLTCWGKRDCEQSASQESCVYLKKCFSVNYYQEELKANTLKRDNLKLASQEPMNCSDFSFHELPTAATYPLGLNQ